MTTEDDGRCPHGVMWGARTDVIGRGGVPLCLQCQSDRAGVSDVVVTWNVRATVVELIEASSVEEAMRELSRRLDRAGFSIYEDPGGPNDLDAFQSEPLGDD